RAAPGAASPVPWVARSAVPETLSAAPAAASPVPWVVRSAEPETPVAGPRVGSGAPPAPRLAVAWGLVAPPAPAARAGRVSGEGWGEVSAPRRDAFERSAIPSRPLSLRSCRDNAQWQQAPSARRGLSSILATVLSDDRLDPFDELALGQGA